MTHTPVQIITDKKSNFSIEVEIAGKVSICFVYYIRFYKSCYSNNSQEFIDTLWLQIPFYGDTPLSLSLFYAVAKAVPSDPLIRNRLRANIFGTCSRIGNLLSNSLEQKNQTILEKPVMLRLFPDFK